MAVGAVVTIGLGFGITQLKFATGQDSYLNKSDQVYKDSVAYQDLFGGQAMLTLVTMDKGHKVDELFTPEAIAQWKVAEAKLRKPGTTVSVVSPLTALQFNNALVASPVPGDPTKSVAGQVLLHATAADKSTKGQAARGKDTVTTLQRLTSIPEDQRVLTNPKYVQFLLYDNEGKIRKPLLANFPDDRHAQIVMRLPGNASIEDEGKAADYTE